MRLAVFSSSVVNQEHNPIGRAQPPPAFRWEPEFNQYIAFAENANRREQVIQNRLYERLVLRQTQLVVRE